MKCVRIHWLLSSLRASEVAAQRAVAEIRADVREDYRIVKQIE
jgi:hypothetical protein